MTRHPLFGLALATAGALLLTPDTMFMRWSGMDGFAMLGWRGLCAALVMLGLWAAAGAPGRAHLFSRTAGLLILCQATNGLLFTLAIATAPVAIVLFAIATTPIFAALLARLLGERAPALTWVAIAAVLAGIAVAVFGRAGGGFGVDLAALLGALGGLGVAAALAASFVIIRHARAIPIQPVIGAGSLIAGLVGLAVSGGPAGLIGAGQIWPIAVTGLVILPGSFLLLTHASRHTPAANVSLLMLLETVLGPLWVWGFAGEPMTLPMIIGGAIVVASLALYIIATARRSQRG